MLEALSLMPVWYFALLFFLVGAVLGSFANVLILRIPEGESVVSPRSRCPSCKKTIRWYDNIPILSWLLLGARCRHCGVKISWRYPFVELITAVVFCGLYLKLGWQWLLVEYMIFSFALIVVTFIDFDHMILPDIFTLSGIVIGLVGAALNPDRSFLNALGGMLMGGGFLWAVAAVYFLLRKEEGMGGGDIKLLAWIGAVLGWMSIPFVILASSLVGSLVGLGVALKTKGGLKSAIPFGPYLVIAALIYIFAGEEIAEWYFHLFVPSLSPVN